MFLQFMIKKTKTIKLHKYVVPGEILPSQSKHLTPAKVSSINMGTAKDQTPRYTVPVRPGSL